MFPENVIRGDLNRAFVGEIGILFCGNRRTVQTLSFTKNCGLGVERDWKDL